MDGLLVPVPWHRALSVCSLEDVFQNDPLDKDLHRKLRGALSNNNDLFVDLPLCSLHLGL